MGSYKNLVNEEGIKKLKELAKSIDVCMFASNLSAYPISVRPMSTREVDEDGTIWFYSREESDKNAEIEADGRVQLFYGNLSSSEYLSVAGNATIIKDEAKAKELWSVWAKTWFNEGPDDPQLTIIKVEPVDVHYWDTKNGRMISLLKIMAGAITGKEMEISIEGKITV